MSHRNARPTRLLWVDLEMTGLDPESQHIIEVAAIVTDFDYNELGSYQTVIHQPPEVLGAADAWVKENFSRSGLFDAVAASTTTGEQAEQALLDLIEAQIPDKSVILAGSSIHQDRRFIRTHWKRLEERLHYRMLDVTAWKVYMMGKYDLMLEKPDVHRALDDIRASIYELSQYTKMIQFEGSDR